MSGKSAPRDRQGFTLIEVMVALVILAVGLLGLEAMGIGAARMVSLSEKQSAYNTVAVSSMEDLRRQVRNTSPFVGVEQPSLRVAVTPGDTAVVTREVARLGAGRANLIVQVSPGSTGPRLLRAQPVRIQSTIWDQNIQ